MQLEKLSGGSKCWDAYGDVCEDGKVHTKPMVLAEVIMAYLDGEQYRLYGGSDKKSKEMNFAKITQFEGKRKTVMVIRNYLKDMLRRSREGFLFLTRTRYAKACRSCLEKRYVWRRKPMPVGFTAL